MMQKRLLIDGKQFVSIQEYLVSGECPWVGYRTLMKKIHEESFPAVKRGKYWWINLEASKLWFKRRDQAS